MGHGPWAMGMAMGMAHGPWSWAMAMSMAREPDQQPMATGHGPWAMSNGQWATQLFEANILTCQDVGGALRMLTS